MRSRDGVTNQISTMRFFFKFHLEKTKYGHSSTDKKKVKAGVHLKAVFTPPKIGLTEISRSRFKQYKNPTLITQINVLGCFVNFLVIFRYTWEEIVFLKRVVKFGEIRNS